MEVVPMLALKLRRRTTLATKLALIIMKLIILRILTPVTTKPNHSLTIFHVKLLNVQRARLSARIGVRNVKLTARLSVFR